MDEKPFEIFNAELKRRALLNREAAVLVGVSAEAIRLWRTGLREISASSAVKISNALDIELHKLRPDLWQPRHSSPPASKTEPQRAPRSSRRGARDGGRPSSGKSAASVATAVPT